MSLKKIKPYFLIVFFFSLLFTLFSWYYQSNFVYSEYLRICAANYREPTLQYRDCLAVFNNQADFYRPVLGVSLAVLVISGLSIMGAKFSKK
jgi:hypothetical protein